MILAPNRRRFLTTALGFVAAPMIVRAASLMPVRAMAVDEWSWSTAPLYRAVIRRSDSGMIEKISLLYRDQRGIFRARPSFTIA